MSVALLSTQSLRIEAGGKTLCSGLDMRIARGEFWCLLGRNGAGKSTLLRTIAGLLAPKEGHVLVKGTDIHSMHAGPLAKLRGLMAQQQFDAFSSTALETVLAGRHSFQAGLGWENDEDVAAARSALSAVGLSGHADKDVITLSGGERQRVALATLLAQDPEIFLLDEPTAQQDAASQLAVMRLIGKMAANGKAAIAACHDINLVSRFATHVMILGEDRHWLGPASTMTPAILGQAFGCRFHVVATAQGRFFIPLA
ncbi:MAG: ATP-binding transporter protein [Noviherbaspirillum sp.]|nr:ATP-binding transporter protein [Noviherbaspirillum sp.]